MENLEEYFKHVFIIDPETIRTDKIIEDCGDYVIIESTYRNKPPENRVVIQTKYVDKADAANGGVK